MCICGRTSSGSLRMLLFLNLKFALGGLGDVLSGTSSAGIHHFGLLEEWFGAHWWNGRFFVLTVTTLAVFAPLASFKRVGEWSRLLALYASLSKEY